MKEKIYTIPLMDAFMEQDECPFCFITRKLEQGAISFVLGSAYMEDDIREQTDEIGFCNHHYKKMYDYGNQLGNALMLCSHIKKINANLKTQLSNTAAQKTPFLNKFKKLSLSAEAPKTAIAKWAITNDDKCYICNHFKNTYENYLDTFFEMLRTNKEFVQIVKDSKGFCIPHFGHIMEGAVQKLSEREQTEFYPILNEVMLSNMERIYEDISWFIEKYDYRNADKDWKNSKDAVPRAMQKLAGGYPADPVFIAER